MNICCLFFFSDSAAGLAFRQVPWEFSDIVPDYILGAKTCALFLSLRYHQLNPSYLADRVQALGRNYELQVCLPLFALTNGFCTIFLCEQWEKGHWDSR